MTKKYYYPALILTVAGLIVVSILLPPSTVLAIDPRISKLTLFNNSGQTIYYAAFERQAAPFARWEVCDHPDICGDDAIRPGLSVDLPYRLIYHWYPGARVVIYWWHLVPDTAAANGHRVDGPHERITGTPNQRLAR